MTILIDEGELAADVMMVSMLLNLDETITKQ